MAREALAAARDREQVGGGAPRRGRERSRARAHRADRGRRPGQRACARRRTSASSRTSGGSSRSRSTSSRRRRSCRRCRRSPAELGAPRGAARAGARGDRGAARRRRRPPTPSATPPARRCADETRAARGARAPRSGRSIATSTRRARGATVNLQSTTTLQHTIERAEEGRQRIGGELGRLDVEAAGSAHRGRAPDAPSACRPRTRSRPRRRRSPTPSPRGRRPTRRSAPRASSASGASATRARTRRRVAASERACGRSRSSRRRAPPTAKRRAWCSARPRPASPHHGSVADYLEVEPGGERAVEAAFGDLLQCVLVETPADADRGLAFVRERGTGRCGFLVGPRRRARRPRAAPAGGRRAGDRRRRARHRARTRR